MKKSLFLFSIILPFLFGCAANPTDTRNGSVVLDKVDSEAHLERTELQAEQGDAVAQGNLGLMYVEGEGVPKDVAIGVKWLTLAAQQGNGKTQNNLGGMYARGGPGLPQDNKAALKWFTLAAKQNHARAQYNLALMYGKGRGVQKDVARTLMWMNMAASNNLSAAQTVSDKLVKLMSSADIANSQKLARECLASNYKTC